MITSRGLTFTYADQSRPALAGVDFDIARGESVLVLGPSGSGKSTLTLTLNGLIPQVVDGRLEGRLLVGGHSTQEGSVAQFSSRVGLVFQDPEAQFCTLTVEDEVAFGLENLCVPPQEIEVQIDRALAQVGLTGFRRRVLSTLSGGEKQRVALASVLAMEPEVLVLDEPSANLDPQGTRELFGIVRRLAQGGGLTLVLIEHKLEHVVEWMDSLLVLDREGKVVYRGDPRTGFYEHGELLAAAGIWRPKVVELVEQLRAEGYPLPDRPLGEEDLVVEPPAAGVDGSALESVCGRVIRRGGQPDGPGVHSASSATESPPLFDIRSLTYAYGHASPTLFDIHARVPKGRITAIVGSNGAGKTTLASLLTGVLRPPAGAVFLEDDDVSRLPARALADRVGHVFQNPEHQVVRDSVREEVAYSLACLKGVKVLAPEEDAEVDRWLERFGLQEAAGANPFALSQGQKRRLSVAAMVVRAQQALVLDEPTFGQDEAHNVRLLDSLAELKEQGKTIVLVTHDMDVVAEYADHLLVLRAGELAYAGEPQGFFAQPELVEVCGLEVPFCERARAWVWWQARPVPSAEAETLVPAERI